MLLLIEKKLPTPTSAPLRADRLLLVPIDVKLAEIEAGFDFRLPMRIRQGRTDDLYPKALSAPNQCLSCYIARIHEMNPRESLHAFKIHMNAFDHPLVYHRHRSGSHVRDHMGSVSITCLGQVYLVSCTHRGTALSAHPGFVIVGRVEKVGCWGDALRLPKMDLTFLPVIIWSQ